MPSLRCIILLVALVATLALASPMPTRTLGKRSFTIPRIKRDIAKTHAWHKRNIQRELAKANRKYGFSTNVVRASAATNGTGNENGEVDASPEENESEFLSPVTVGGQKLNLDFDTGSSDLWVFSTQLSRRTIGQHAAFDSTKSATFKNLTGSTWLITYGDGSGAAGIVGTDTVDIGGATVTEQAVEMATAVSQSFVQDTNNDGLVGLAFSKLNTVKPQKQKTFFDNIMPNLDLPVFTADLTNDSTGTYEFGKIDTTKFKGDLTDVPVNASTGFWTVQSNSFTIDGQVFKRTGASPAIADTGTSLLLVDDEVAQAYYSKVQGAQNDADVGGFTYPCDTQLPSFGVAMGDYVAEIPGDAITFAEVTPTTCFGGVQGTGGGNLQIYGDVMFKTQFVVFNGAESKLQIAPKN